MNATMRPTIGRWDAAADGYTVTLEVVQGWPDRFGDGRPCWTAEDPRRPGLMLWGYTWVEAVAYVERARPSWDAAAPQCGMVAGWPSETHA